MLEKIKKRGQVAKELMDNEAFQKAFQDLHKEYYSLFTSTGLEDSEKREHIFFSVNALADVKKRLEEYYDQAKYEQAKAEKANAK